MRHHENDAVAGLSIPVFLISRCSQMRVTRTEFAQQLEVVAGESQAGLVEDLFDLATRESPGETCSGMVSDSQARSARLTFFGIDCAHAVACFGAKR